MSQSVEEELEVLSAIYSDDEEFTLGTGSWGSKLLTVRCSSICLMITLPQGYPKSAAPIVHVKRVPGETKKKLSEHWTGVLEEELKNLIVEWREGEREVCCYNIISHAKEFVEQNEKEQRDLFSTMKSREDNAMKSIKENLAMEKQRVVEVDLSREEDEDVYTEKKATQLTSMALPDKDGLIEGEEDRMEQSENDGRDSIFKGLLDSHSRGGLGASRYTSEFDEIAMIGSGGYGKVYKCRNRLDGRIYAVKKCSVATSDVGVFKKIRREVTTISRLLHGHIVRYYAAWLEDGEIADGDSSTIETSSFGGQDLDSELLMPSIRELSSGFMFQSRNSDDDEDEDEDDDDDEDEDEGEDDVYKSQKLGQLSINSSDPSNVRRKRTLFILMEYCEGTLREAIDEENLSVDDALSLFRQLLDALNFIHSKGIIHRDIKPSNILLRDGSVRLGDFGLAVAQAAAGDDSSSQGHPSNKTSTTDNPESLTAGIGTQLYCAPEQLNSVGTKRSDGAPAYNAAVDIFSCGIVLFELLHKPFVTFSERIFVIRELREKRKFDKEFLERSDLKGYQKLILSMIDSDPKQRPTAHDLLESPLLPIKMFINQQSLSSAIDPSKFYALAYDSLRGATIPRSARESSGRGDSIFISQQEALVNLQAYLESLFQLRGAVEMKSPSFSVKTRGINVPDSTMLLSGTGSVLHLPHEPLDTWATFLDETPSLQSVMHYEFAKVYTSQKGLGFEHPLYHMSVLYDCLAPKTSSELVDFDILSAAWSLADMLARSATTSNIHMYITDWRLLRSITDALLLHLSEEESVTLGTLSRERELVISRYLKEEVVSNTNETARDTKEELIARALSRLEQLIESLQNMPPAGFLSSIETYFQSLFIERQRPSAPLESPSRVKPNIEEAIAAIGTKKKGKRPSNEGLIAFPSDVKTDSSEDTIATIRDSLKRKFAVSVFHLRNALKNLEYCFPDDKNAATKVHLQLKLSIPGKIPADFRNQDGPCFSVESAADPGRKIRSGLKSSTGPHISKGRVLVYGGHFERLLRSRKSSGTSSSAAMIVHHHVVSFLVNKNTYDQRGAPCIHSPQEVFTRRTLFSSCLDVLVVYKSRDHAYGAEQSRICAVLAALRKQHIRCSFNTNQLISGPITLESVEGQSAAGKALNVAELRRLHSLRVPFVVVLTPQNTDFAKVYSVGKDPSDADTVALSDLTTYITSNLRGQQGFGQTIAESNLSNDSAVDISPRGPLGPSSVEARLVFSPGIFSQKSSNKEVFRRRQNVKERLVSFLQSLFGGGTVDLSIDDSPPGSSDLRLRTGPEIFASNASVDDLQYFQGIVTSKGAKQLILEDFSDEARLDKRHWLKPLFNFVKSKTGKGIVFLYSIPSDDLVLMECG